MTAPALHRFEHNSRFFAIDPESCFCFECDAISWDVIEHYPRLPVSAILRRLEEKYPRRELEEVISELEWFRGAKSILKQPGQEELKSRYAAPGGVREVTVVWPVQDGEARIAAAANLLLARGEAPLRLIVRIRAANAGSPALLAALASARRAAQVAAKPLAFTVEAEALLPARVAEALRAHALHAQLEISPGAPVEAAAALGRIPGDTLAGWAKRLDDAGDETRAVLVVRPRTAEFGGILPALSASNFRNISLDIAPLYAGFSGVDAQTVFRSLGQAASDYAQSLLRGEYRRIDPFAPLFWRIYQGKPEPRSETAGTRELAVDADGSIYPAPCWLGRAEHALGNLASGTLDEAARKRFEDIGALTTPVCMKCWARNLCGGGSAAIHQARSGDFRRPEAVWCGLQRAYLESAIGAFNTLSAAGVNFSRIYQALGRIEKPSLFQLARAAFRTHLGVRPMEEGDAALLTRWENWNFSAYFALHEGSMLMSTTYDREMDALYPREYEHELMLLRRDASPLGLLRVRPSRQPGLAHVFIYLPRPQDYADSGVRRGFREILREAAGQRALQTIVTPAGPFDRGLAEFLTVSGYTKAGIERQALYVHGRYHDVPVYSLALGL